MVWTFQILQTFTRCQVICQKRLVHRILPQRMPKNVEIKARIHSLEKFLSRARPLADQPEAVLVQEDTYFQVPNGRLKLRETQGEATQLVFYDRPDTEGPKLSKYNKQFFSNRDEANGLKEVLTSSLGVRGVVFKSRTLIMVGQTRVHVDQVKQLGHFMELEVVLRDDQSLEEGQRIAEDLMVKLGVQDKDLLSCSYIDLLLKDDKKSQDSASKQENDASSEVSLDSFSVGKVNKSPDSNQLFVENLAQKTTCDDLKYNDARHKVSDDPYSLGWLEKWRMTSDSNPFCVGNLPHHTTIDDLKGNYACSEVSDDSFSVGNVDKWKTYPDSKQLFVGNLPHNITIDDLKEIFQKFGLILDIKMNAPSAKFNDPGKHPVPCYGFIYFDDEESVQTVMQNKPIRFGERRLNIEEKKNKPRKKGDGIMAPGRGSGHRGSGARGRGRGINYSFPQ